MFREYFSTRYTTDFVPALGTSDVRTSRQWFLPSSFIVSAASGILKDYPIIIHPSRGTLALFPRVIPEINRRTRHLREIERRLEACARPH